MAVIHWVGGSSTHFNDPNNWNPPGLPNSTSDVIIGAGFTIDSPATITINSLALAATSALTINAATGFTVNTGTNGAGIAGTLNVANSAVMSIGGTIVNSGTINESSTGTTTEIILTQTTNTLTGGGKLVLSANTNNLIFATTSTFLLDNQDNTISGGGNIGNGSMVLSNEGIINANQSTATLTVNTGGNVITNSGTMEATNGGDLNIVSAVNNVGGTIEAVGAGSVVVLQGNVTGGTVTTSGGGVIQTSGASGVLDGLGLHPVTNGSAIQVLNGQALTLLGTIINNSSISLNATANATNLRIGSPTVTLKGTGAIHLTNNANNQIFGTTAAFKLVNLTNTIDGAGLLGAGSLAFSNAGTVNANQPGSLTLNTGANLAINTGLMESSNTGGLVILNTAVDNAGGTIQALVAGSHVDLSGGTIQGGTLKTANGGVIETISGNGGLDGITYGVLNNTGTFLVKDQTVLSLSGTINNTGLISESQTSGSGNTQIRISSQNVTLKGGGKLTMSNSALNLIVGTVASNTLTNVDNTISGAGAIGGGANMFLVNQTKGIINANQSTALTVRTDADIITNAGTMEGTSTGGLVLWNTAFNNAGGTIMAVGAGAHVDLQTAYIEGGTLTSSGGGVIKTVDTGNTLDGITAGILNNKGTLQVNDQTRLSLVGVINNTGLISENQTSNSGSTQIRIASQNVTLQGGGKLTMSNNALNQFFGNAASNTLVNVDNTISGAGAIGGGANMFLVNQTKGVINANQSVALTVRTDANIITNAGTMEGTSTGGLVLWNTAFNNAGGTIEALGAGAHVDLLSAYIEGGILTTATGGVIKTTDNGSSALDGITAGVVTNSGTIQIVDSTRLGLVGVINNTGTINEASSGGATSLRIIGNTTLQGAGKVVMSDNVSNQIFGTNAGFQFANVDNTISGAGAIGVGASMILVNQTKGVINANAFNALTVGTGANIITNAGTMEATSAVASNGGLVISSTTVNNAGGTIEALGALAHVNLQSANIEGGKLTTTGKGVIETVDTGSTLDGITSGVLTNSGTVLVLDHSALSLVGTISNSGTIFEDATSVSGATTVHIVGQSATLSGAGQFLMSDNANNAVSGSQLINAGNLISGAGQFGNGGMDFDNKTGTLKGTGTNALVLNLGQGNLLNEAAANIAATGAGGVSMTQGIFTNKGTMTANDGSSLIYQSGALNTNLSAGALIGGTWRAIAAGHGATLTLSSSAGSGGVVTTDAAIVQLSGSGSLIQSFDPTSGTIKSLEQTLTSVATGGQLQVLANRGYISTLDLTDSGIVQLGGGTMAVGTLTIATGGLLVGLGTVDEAPINTGKIEAKGGLLAITGAITGTGGLQIDAASTLEVGGATTETATFTGVGTLKLDLPGSAGPIAGLILNDVIDLGGVTDVTKTAVVGSTLTVTRSGHPNLTYTVSGTGLAGNHFAFALDGTGGTNLTLVGGPGAAAVVPLGSSGGGSGSGPFINLGGSDPTWIGGSGNSFNTAANWNPSTVPVAGSDAVITLAGAAVVSSVANTMATLAMGTTDSLEIAGASNTFTVTNGSGIGDLKGTITVDNSDILVLGGTIVNSGQIKLGSTGSNTDLRIGSAIVDLQGTGAIHLSNNGSNRIFSNSANFQLINETNTIDGAGQLGAASLTFTNKKLVNANQTTALTLNTQGNIVVNTGTLQASSSGGLVIQNTTVNNAGGTIQALVAKSHVDLAGGTIEGGTLATAAGGVIQTVGGNGALDGITAGVLNNKGTVLVNDQTTLSLLGVINNTGTIAETQLSSGGSTNIRIASQNVTLQGGGKLTMTNNSLNQLIGNNAAFTLTNVDNTISGAGAIGGGASMFLVNQAKGVINANQAPTFFQSGQLVINTGANLLVNNGTLESTSTGGLEIVNTAVNNAGAIDTNGTVLAAGAGAHVDLNGATIMGGVLATSGGGVIQTVANSGLDGITYGTLSNTGTMLVADQTRLDLAGTINNTGSILVDQESTTLSTTLRVTSQTVTLQGGGQVAMSNSSLNQLIGSAGSNTLVNVDNTVSGAGTIGGGANMVLVNQTKGIINANQTTALIVRTDANIITNTGTMEGTGTGGLVLWNTTFNNAGGTIEAVGAGALVDLQSAYIEGGILTTSGGGVIQTVDRASTLDGITAGTLSNSGLIQLNDNTLLSLVGVINNTGTISEAASSKGSSSTVLRLVGDTTLQGGGDVVMSNNASNQIFGNNGAFHLTNVDNTIAGAGLIGGAANMILVNQAKGIINANQKTSLIVRTDANIITNAGTMESTGTAALNGGLVLWNTAINNAGGTIQAVGAQANVDLQSVYIEGGTLTTSGGGVIQTVDAASTLDGITSGVLTTSGTVVVNDSMMLSLVGTIANSGTIMESGFGNTGNTRLKLTGPVTLTGAGKVLMSDNPNNQMFSSANLFTLTNQGNVISGAGQFGAGGMSFDNKSGQIRATGANAMVVNLGQGTGLNEAAGIIAGDGAGGMILTSGYFTNNGVMAANNGSAITFQSGAVNVNLAEGDLVGGTWRAISTGLGATFTISGSAAGGGAVVNDGAIILLQGAGSVIQSFDPTSATIKPLEQTMTSVASGGQLQVLANRGYSSGLNFTDSGIVQLGGGTFQTNSLSVTSGAKFFGFGTVQDSVSNAGLIEVNTGTLTVTGSISGAGTLQADAGTTLVLTGPSIQAAKVTDNGTVNLGGGIVQATTLTVAAGAKLIGFGTVQNAVTNAGLIEANGGTLTVTGSITGAGTLQADSAATLALTGSSILASKVNDNGTVSLGGGTLKATTFTVASGSKLIGFGTVQNAVANAGTIEANGGTLTVTGAITGAGTLQADSAATLALTASSILATQVTDNGTVSLGGGTLKATTFTVAGGSKLIGFGTVQNAVSNAGLVEANGGTLAVTGAITGAGTLQADSGATLALTGAVSSATKVTDNGTVSLGVGDKLTVTGSVDPASTGVFLLNNSSVLDVAVDKGTSNKMSFIGTGQLSVEAIAQFGNNIGTTSYTGPLLENFGAGDTVQLKDLNFAGASIVSYTSASGLLQLANGATKSTLLFQDSTLGGTKTFHLNNDGGGHVLLTET